MRLAKALRWGAMFFAFTGVLSVLCFFAYANMYSLAGMALSFGACCILQDISIYLMRQKK